jgi:hypothetical protein
MSLLHFRCDNGLSHLFVFTSVSFSFYFLLFPFKLIAFPSFLLDVHIATDD